MRRQMLIGTIWIAMAFTAFATIQAFCANSESLIDVICAILVVAFFTFLAAGATSAANRQFFEKGEE